MRAYSQDLRERVVAACDEGQSSRQQLAQRFGVSTAWIRRLLQRRRQTGSFAALPQRPGRKPKVAGPHAQRLLALVTEQPDATLAELRQRLGLALSLSALWQALQRLDVTRKKSRCGRPSKTAPTSNGSGSAGGGGRGPSPRSSGSSSTRRRPTWD